jgi:hypothetical protein
MPPAWLKTAGIVPGLRDFSPFFATIAPPVYAVIPHCNAKQYRNFATKQPVFS